MRRASATFGDVHSGLDRDHHARLKLGRFSWKDQKPRVVIAEANVVAGVMGEERRESLSCDLVSRQGVDVAGGNTGTYAIDSGLLSIFDNVEYLSNLGLRRTYRGGAREVAPITIDASCQFNQDEVAIL